MNAKFNAASRSRTVNRQPLLWAALAFAGGIATGVYVWRPPSWWLAAGILLGIFSACYMRRRAWAACALALAAIFATGAFVIQASVPITSSGAELLQFASGREVQITGHVAAEAARVQESFGESRQTLDVETEQVSAEGQTLTVQSRARIGFYGKLPRNESDQAVAPTPLPVFHYGDRLRFTTKLYAPRNFRDPGAFDYEGYLAEKGIAALGSSKTEEVKLLPGFAGSRAENWRNRIRRNITEKIQVLWPAEQAALVEAMLLGQESFLGRALKLDFQRSGTYHVLVISGLKVGILALVAFWALRRLRVGDVAASAAAVLLTIGYALLTDVGAPVWRATLMLAVYLGARLLYRQRSTLNALGAAALAILVLDPAELRGASFQLSFLCMLLIAGVAWPLLERTTQPLAHALRHLDSLRYDASLPPPLAQTRLDLRMIAGRLERFFGKRVPLPTMALTARALVAGCEFLLISVVLQIGLTCPMAYYFHRATLVALPANILAVPLTEFIMVVALVTVAVSYFSLFIAKSMALIAGMALGAISGTVHWLGGLRIADARLATPELAVILACAATLALAMVLIRRRPWIAAAGTAALMGSAFWIYAVPPRPQIQLGKLEVTALDVGQGDSILLVLPRGRILLVDAGGLPQWMHSDLDIGEDVVSPYLWSRGITHLDAVVVTHAHSDHIGGMGAILANFHPRELWLGVDAPSPELQSVLREARELGISIVPHRAGDDFAVGGSTVRVLAPDLDPVTRTGRANDDCIVMKVSFGGTSALLEGDAERVTERRVAEEEPQADLLKVAHHGSATSTIPELLAAVRPRFAVISVGARNTYGHPRAEVLGRLAEARVATYRTDLDGAVTFYLDGKTVSPRRPDLR